MKIGWKWYGRMERAPIHRRRPKYSFHNPWVRDNNLQIASSEKLCGDDKHVLHALYHKVLLWVENKGKVQIELD